MSFYGRAFGSVKICCWYLESVPTVQGIRAAPGPMRGVNASWRIERIMDENGDVLDKLSQQLEGKGLFDWLNAGAIAEGLQAFNDDTRRSGLDLIAKGILPALALFDVGNGVDPGNFEEELKKPGGAFPGFPPRHPDLPVGDHR